MRNLVVGFAAACALVWAGAASAGGWDFSVPFTNQVASSPTIGGGYPVPEGATAPLPGTCRLGDYNSNRSESWVAVQPGTENLVGVSKFFFEKFSTFYDFHLGSYTMPGAVPGPNTQIPGYDCISTGTQEMPPSWTNNTDPNVDFDTQGRAHQITLPFNAFWANLHPNGAIGAVYSDDLGASWTVGNQGKYLDRLPNSSSFAFGDVVDKQWVAVNQSTVSPYVDHVYAMWSLFNGNAVKIRFAKSVDRGEHFTPARTITPPNVVGPSTTYIYPDTDAGGTLYAAVASFHAKLGSSDAELFVARSTDDGATFTWFDTGARAHGTPGCCLPNTTFRDGILENFAASPTYSGHLYLTYEDWDGTQFDVKFIQSTDGGMTWTDPVVVNDPDPNDQFQPSVAAGPGGAVAIAFYDRREACPEDDPFILEADQGADNFCIDVTLQAYKDEGDGAEPVLGNVRITDFTWDPEQPGQTIDGLDQMACAGHSNPCTSRAFIGDYFGLAVSDSNIYALFVSTHYPSGVIGDGDEEVRYQQQVLATVPRADLGL
jgi:hypothetical protein